MSSIEFPDGSLDRLIELAVARILSTGQPILTQNASSFETYGTRLCHEVGGELGPHPIPPRARLDSHHRAVSRLQIEAAIPQLLLLTVWMALVYSALDRREEKGARVQEKNFPR